MKSTHTVKAMCLFKLTRVPSVCIVRTCPVSPQRGVSVSGISAPPVSPWPDTPGRTSSAPLHSVAGNTEQQVLFTERRQMEHCVFTSLASFYLGIFFSKRLKILLLRFVNS